MEVDNKFVSISTMQGTYGRQHQLVNYYIEMCPVGCKRREGN